VNPAMPLRSVALVLVLILLALALGAADTAGAFSGDTEVLTISKKLQCPV